MKIKYSNNFRTNLEKSYKVVIVLKNIHKKAAFCWFFINCKVFRDFFKRIAHMKMSLVVIIAGGIVILAIILTLILTSYQESEDTDSNHYQKIGNLQDHLRLIEVNMP